MEGETHVDEDETLETFRALTHELARVMSRAETLHRQRGEALLRLRGCGFSFPFLAQAAGISRQRVQQLHASAAAVADARADVRDPR